MRRLNSGVIYSPVSATTPDGTYLPVSSTNPTITAIDSNWERVEITEPATEEKLFVKVEVSFPVSSDPVEITLECTSTIYGVDNIVLRTSQ